MWVLVCIQVKGHLLTVSRCEDIHISDEKEKYDPIAFRDNILQGFTEADSNLEQARSISFFHATGFGLSL